MFVAISWQFFGQNLNINKLCVCICLYVIVVEISGCLAEGAWVSVVRITPPLCMCKCLCDVTG